MKKIITLFCFLTVSITTFSQELASTAAITSVSCNGECNGMITATATGGSGAYEYSIDGGNTFTALNIFTNLCAGEYEVYTKDSEGAIVSQTVVLDEPPLLTISVNVNGNSVEVLAIGGVGGYEYSINNEGFVNTNTFSDLSEGNYLLTVRDSYGCYTQTTFTINNTPNPITSNVNIVNVTCYGSCNGYIEVTATGGSGNYTYKLFNEGIEVVTSTSNVFDGLCAGEYYIEVNDGINVHQTQNIIINESNPIAITATVTPTGNEPSGVIKVEATGGIPPYVYDLLDNTGVVLVTGQNSIFSDLSEGSYMVSVVDSVGCFSILNIDVTKEDVDTTIERNGDDLTAPLEADSYQWFDAATQTKIEGVTSKSFKVTETGSYRVEMTISSTSTSAKRGTQVYSSPTYQVAVLGLAEENLEVLHVYPNPVSKKVVLPSKVINSKYKIYTILGKEIKYGNVLNQNLNIEDLSSGIYYLKIKDFKTVKLIKQ